MSDPIIRYGMVGGDVHAFIGEVHRKAIQFDPRAKLVAGCFSNILDYNKETAQTYGVSDDRCYADYHEMVQKESVRSDKINFVSIVTPNFLHYEIAKEFLQAGFHVVCEKPLCFAIAEAQELEELAKKNKLLFAVTYAYTGYAMVRYMKQMIEQGAIGNIATVNCEYAQDWLIDELSEQKNSQKNLSVWRKDPKFSGISNCVGDIGTHIESVVHFLTGLEIDSVSAIINNYGHALDLNANILVKFKNNVTGAYWCSQIATGRMNGLVIRLYGDQGSLEWEQHYPDYVKYTAKGKPPQILSRGSSYLTGEAAKNSRIPCGHPEGYYIAFANIYKNFISAVVKSNQGKQPTANELGFPTVKDGNAGVKFVHAVIESGKDNSKWVKI